MEIERLLKAGAQKLFTQEHDEQANHHHSYERAEGREHWLGREGRSNKTRGHLGSLMGRRKDEGQGRAEERGEEGGMAWGGEGR